MHPFASFLMADDLARGRVDSAEATFQAMLKRPDAQPLPEALPAPRLALMRRVRLALHRLRPGGAGA